MLHLAFVFVGIVGQNHVAVEHQLEPTLKKLGITERSIPERELAAIVKETPAGKKLVKSLHAGGVVAGQLSGSGSSRTFRVVIYDADGNLVSEVESPISARTLTRGDIAMFASNVQDITGSSPAQPAGSAVAGDSSLPGSGGDDDAPPGMAGAASGTRVAAADDDSTGAAAPQVSQHASPSQGGHALQIQLGLQAGIVGRSMLTDPNTVRKYTSDPVGTGGVEGEITFAHAHLAGVFEHTLTMHTDVAGGSASTDIGRFELAASYDVLHGSVQVAPVLGFGERYFAVDSMTTARSPDVDYQYVLLGATVAKQLGTRWTQRGLAAYEPVVGGLPPGMGPAPSRYGYDFGAALEVRATRHVFARAAFDYQVFSCSWASGGAAMDNYPAGSASAGAVF
jgi:hypothetical protein